VDALLLLLFTAVRHNDNHVLRYILLDRRHNSVLLVLNVINSCQLLAAILVIFPKTFV